jgi:plasmid stabilization system protein ParE
MTQVIVTAPASADQAEILRYLAGAGGAQTAVKYAARFMRLFDLLAEFPGIGAPRPGLGSRIRVGIVLPYLVFYDYNEGAETVTILRIVHGGRNITSTLLS